MKITIELDNGGKVVQDFAGSSSAGGNVGGLSTIREGAMDAGAAPPQTSEQGEASAAAPAGATGGAISAGPAPDLSQGGGS